jgi:hypothetical protein
VVDFWCDAFESVAAVALVGKTMNDEATGAEAALSVTEDDDEEHEEETG